MYNKMFGIRCFTENNEIMSPNPCATSCAEFYTVFALALWYVNTNFP